MLVTSGFKDPGSTPSFLGDEGDKDAEPLAGVGKDGKLEVDTGGAGSVDTDGGEILLLGSN